MDTNLSSLIDKMNLGTTTVSDGEALRGLIEALTTVTPQQDSLHLIFLSAKSFNDRFRGQSLPSITEAKKVFMEEFRECCLAIDDERAGIPSVSGHDFLCEFMDLIFAGCMVAISSGYPYEEMKAAAEYVALKNDRKDHSSHYVNRAGKIARRPEPSPTDQNSPD